MVLKGEPVRESKMMENETGKHPFGRGSCHWSRNYGCWVDWMLCFSHSSSSSSLFHLSKYHYHPPNSLSQRPRNHTCFSLLPPIQGISKMYLECICLSSFPQLQMPVISHQDYCGPNWSYMWPCSFIICSPFSHQRKSGSATLSLEILHCVHVAFNMKSKSALRSPTRSDPHLSFNSYLLTILLLAPPHHHLLVPQNSDCFLFMGLLHLPFLPPRILFSRLVTGSLLIFYTSPYMSLPL